MRGAQGRLKPEGEKINPPSYDNFVSIKGVNCPFVVNKYKEDKLKVDEKQNL